MGRERTREGPQERKGMDTAELVRACAAALAEGRADRLLPLGLGREDALAYLRLWPQYAPAPAAKTG